MSPCGISDKKRKIEINNFSLIEKLKELAVEVSIGVETDDIFADLSK